MSLSPERLAANETAIGWDGRDLLAENERLRAIEAAARDPFLVLLDRHPGADPVVNAEMRRAAARLRKALADRRGEA